MAQKTYKHVEWIDLRLDNILEEIVIMGVNEGNGDIYHISTKDLDAMDLARLRKVLNKPTAHLYPLWENMANDTLKNGMNTLEFFHQLVKIRTVQGRILPVNSGRIGAGYSSLTPRPVMIEEEKRGPGRPPAKRD